MNTTHQHGASHTHPDSASCHSMDKSSAKEYLRKFWIVTFLLIPLLATNKTIADLLGLPYFESVRWLQFAIASVIFYFSFVFFRHAWMEIKSKNYGMMTLVSMATLSGYLFSAFTTFLPQLNTEFYIEISTLIWVLLFGHYLEAKSSAAAGNALEYVAKLLPKKAHRITQGQEYEDVEILDLKAGDLVLIKPGEKAPADGIVVKGQGAANESHISGESKPVFKKEGDNILAGSTIEDSSFVVKITKVGSNSTVGQIERLIQEAQNTKPASQKLADKASKVLTVVAGVVAVVTLLVWSVLLGQPFVFAMTLAITVLVIACPHALGLAIPAVTTITTTLASKHGLFIKDLSKIEIIRKASIVVFDKTGTLTEGEFGVEDILVFAKGFDKKRVLQIAASAEMHSSHFIGTSIVKRAKNEGIEFLSIENFENIPGVGIKVNVSGKTYFIGKEPHKSYRPQETEVAGTKVYISDENETLGLIILSDKVRLDAQKAVSALKEMGIKTAMITGDNESVAKIIAKHLGLDKYFAEVMPEDKYKYIKELQDKGEVVLMVGDGVNDAPALVQADAGVAIGAGVDVAVEAGDVVLIKNNPYDVVRLIKLAKVVYSKMVQNLVWALGYNIVAIPLAAGVLASWNVFLRPEFAAIVMSLSTVIVVANAMLLKRFNA